MSRQVQRPPAPADVVAAFNVVGYQATFAAAAAELVPPTPVAALYAAYPSREALAEAWLSACIRKDKLAGTLGTSFSECAFGLVVALSGQRDFSHAWLAALRQAGTRLEQLEGLSDSLQDYYVHWLRKHSNAISLPEPLVFDDVLIDLAEALSLATLRTIAAWGADRSSGFSVTNKRIESTAFLIDGLLTSSAAFGGRGLLVHMVELFDVPSEKLLGPVMDLLRRPDRATSLVQLLAPPSGRIVQPLLGLPDRARHLFDLLARELRAADEALR